MELEHRNGKTFGRAVAVADERRHQQRLSRAAAFKFRRAFQVDDHFARENDIQLMEPMEMRFPYLGAGRINAGAERDQFCDDRRRRDHIGLG